MNIFKTLKKRLDSFLKRRKKMKAAKKELLKVRAIMNKMPDVHKLTIGEKRRLMKKYAMEIDSPEMYFDDAEKEVDHIVELIKKTEECDKKYQQTRTDAFVKFLKKTQ